MLIQRHATDEPGREMRQVVLAQQYPLGLARRTRGEQCYARLVGTGVTVHQRLRHVGAVRGHLAHIK